MSCVQSAVTNLDNGYLVEDLRKPGQLLMMSVLLQGTCGVEAEDVRSLSGDQVRGY